MILGGLSLVQEKKEEIINKERINLFIIIYYLLMKNVVLER